MARSALTMVIAFVCGSAIAGAVAALVLWVTNDMRLVLLLGAAGLVGAAALVGGLRRGGVVSFLMLCLPLTLLFGLGVVPELPGLWPHIVFWLGFALLGWLGFRFTKRFGRAAIGACFALSALAGWYALSYVPGAISQTLNQALSEPAPEYALASLDGASIGPETFQRKVVVLDFFATWCAPCIVELPEIDAIHRRYADADDVVVLVVANDSGSDTPESIRRFAEARDLDVRFVYDQAGAAHEAFGFAGLPGLVIIDAAGQVRFRREGYNAAEVDFEDNVVGIIESLRASAAN